MKRKIKQSLSRLGAYTGVDLVGSLNLIRLFPEIYRWYKKGCSDVAPYPVKRKVVTSYLRSRGLKTFVETGTYTGETLAEVAVDRTVQATSIELADRYYRDAKRRFSSCQNVTLLHGDSGKLLPEVVDKLQAPALFWLDGHYSGDLTAKGDLETPISAELQAILSSSIAGHVILIDDVRCFDGSHDYPHLDELLAVIRRDGRYKVEVSTDILRLTWKH